MKKFARCVLILILVMIVSGVCGYLYEDKTQTTMYTSTAQLYVVPGEENEATVRASNGGLKDDFIIVFKSGVVIEEAQKIAGTSENIAQYLTVASPANSNIVEITCTNPDQNTAKQYVDAVAKTALKTTSIIPVKSIQILSEGTVTNVPVKPDLYRNTFLIVAVSAAACVVLELVVVLVICAFKKPEDHSDDEFEYEKYYGKYAAIHAPQPQNFIDDKKTSEEQKKEPETSAPAEKEKPQSDMRDILEDFDEDYAEEDVFGEDETFDEESEDVFDDNIEDDIDAAYDDAAAAAEEEQPAQQETETAQEDALEEQVLAEYTEEEQAEAEITAAAESAAVLEEETVQEPEQEKYKVGQQSSAQVLGRIKK